jgi:hypothetical protein
MVGHDPQADIGTIVGAVAGVGELLRPIDERSERVGLEDRRNALQQDEVALEARGCRLNCMKTRFQNSRKRSSSTTGPPSAPNSGPRS